MRLQPRLTARITGRTTALAVALAVAVAAASCASPAKLARQSSDALAKGDLRRAYDRALSAVEKDPQHQGARDAYAVASGHVAADYQRRVTATAAGDTVRGANLAMEYARFRAEVARHATPLAATPEYDRAERAIQRGAARVYYERGADAMAAGRPRIAVDEFTVALRYDADYPRAAERLDAARHAAITRVALFPFVDRIGVPGLTQEIADTVQHQLDRRARSDFRFTELVDVRDLEQNMSVAELRNLSAIRAIEVARRVDADLAVTGVVRGGRSNSSQRSAKLTIYHRIDSTDSTGATVSRWREMPLPVTTRTREVNARFDVEIFDASTGELRARRENAVTAIARVAWTDFRADQPYDRYALLPPDVRGADPERAKQADAAWREELGSWELRDFLRHSREQRGRNRYSGAYRGEFYSDTRGRPAWLGELPSESELMFVALRDVWREVFAALKELDSAR